MIKRRSKENKMKVQHADLGLHTDEKGKRRWVSCFTHPDHEPVFTYLSEDVLALMIHHGLGTHVRNLVDENVERILKEMWDD